MKEKLFYVISSSLMVVLTILVLNLHSELEMTRNDMEGLRVDLTVATNVRRSLEEVEGRMGERIQALETRIDEQRLEMAAMEKRTGTVLEKITKILKEVGAESLTLEGTSSVSTLAQPDARAMMRREAPSAERTIEAALGATTPALIDFPAEVLSVERLASPDLKIKAAGSTLALYSDGGLDEDRDSLRISLKDGSRYLLRLRWATKELGRTIAADVVDNGSRAALRPKAKEFSVELERGGAANVILPASIRFGFARSGSPLTIESADNMLVMKAGEGLDEKGEAVVVKLADGRTIALRGRLAGPGQRAMVQLDLTGPMPRAALR